MADWTSRGVPRHRERSINAFHCLVPNLQIRGSSGTARTGTDNIWVRETKKKLARVEKMYFEEYLDPTIEKKLDDASDKEAEVEQLAAAEKVDPEASDQDPKTAPGDLTN